MKKFILKLVVITIVIFTSIDSFAQTEKLVFALDLIRHGDRTPYESLPNASHTWAEGGGQLTAEGMRQAFQLGEQLREKYIKTTHLLPDNYVIDTIYARSTDFDRTLMSAQSVLMGLYPLGTGPVISDTNKPALPSGFQPIAIHTVPLSDETALLPNIEIRQSDKLLNKYVFTRADWKQKSAELQANFSRWSQMTGVQIKSVFQLLSLADTVTVYKAHRVALPNGMTEQDANDIIEAGNWVYSSLFKPSEVGDASGGKILANIANYLDGATKNNADDEKSKLKFVLLLGHDVTLLSVMSALHAPLDRVPPYLSDLNFSLYEMGSNNYVVKVTFNGQPVEIPGCNKNECSLSDFMRLAAN